MRAATKMTTKDLYELMAGKPLVEVHFIKKNGEDRVMKCTADSEHIPGEVPIDPSADFKYSKHLTAWDFDKESFRKINPETVYFVKDLIKDEILYSAMNFI